MQYNQDSNMNYKLFRNNEVVDDGEELDIDEPVDDWNKQEPDDSADFDREPTQKEIPQQEPTDSSKVQKKQTELQQLLYQKDKLLLQYKSGQLSLDQYRDKIGNIPQQIKRLKDQVDKAMNVTVNDQEDELA